MPTGYPLDDVLETLGWFGKRFHTNLRADGMGGKTGLLTLWGGRHDEKGERPSGSLTTAQTSFAYKCSTGPSI
ncbi:hypothetical protein [Ensifer sp. 1H6]|uniref:hypothetical protein n=1 Tax=Ensifer sp. 1H6 TaxID=1911585 RepID=UPI0032AFF513